MRRILVWRTARSLALVAVAASLAYLLAAAALDPRAALAGRGPRDVVERRLDALNLSDRRPLHTRYTRWASGVARGDFGRTLDGAPVAAELGRRVGVSLRLLLAGAVLGSALGVASGAYGAVRRHRLGDRLVTTASMIVISVPAVVLAVLLQMGAQWANDLAGARLFEWSGEYAPDGGARLRHLLLPTLAVALVQAAVCSRYQRGTMLDALDAGYVRAAMARGLRRPNALVRHALRVAVVPVVAFSAYGAATLPVCGAITEKVFGRHGVGEWLIDSIGIGDVNAVAACAFATAVFVVAAGLLADAAGAVLDPRARAT